MRGCSVDRNGQPFPLNSQVVILEHPRQQGRAGLVIDEAREVIAAVLAADLASRKKG